MGITRNRKLYMDGNTVYGIDEECMRKRELFGCNEEERRLMENYMSILMNLFYFQL